MNDDEGDAPLFFRASSVEKENWDDHDYLRYMGDGLTHVYYLVKPASHNRSNTIGTVLGIALSIMVLILVSAGGVPR